MILTSQEIQAKAEKLYADENFEELLLFEQKKWVSLEEIKEKIKEIIDKNTAEHLIQELEVEQ